MLYKVSRLNIAIIIFSLCFHSSCNDNPNAPKHTDTVRTGTITIATDPVFQPFTELTIDAYEHDCKDQAHIKLLNIPESKAIELLQKDSVRLIIMSRKLTAEENEPFKKRKIEIAYSLFAYDAIALIVHPSMPDSIKFEELMDVLNGKIDTWKKLNPKLPNENIQIVFDNDSSSTVRYMQNLVKKPFGKNVGALDENKKVVEYVATHPEAIGIVGLNWISDGRDPKLGSFMEKVNVVGIMPADTSVIPEKKYYKPLQYHLFMQHYPLMRAVYSVNAEARQGLGTGFVHYLNGRPGQLIIQSSGLLPGTLAVWKRQIHIKEE
ncbi:MAG: substrate-binding domain-containing protein [Bacteroidota bacterium]|nr:substrate-binding domain-containing protein [Bacteroidota bacterium]